MIFLALLAVFACIFLAGCTANTTNADISSSQDNKTAMTMIPATGHDNTPLYSSPDDALVGTWTNTNPNNGLKTIIKVNGDGTAIVTAIYDDEDFGGIQKIYWGKESDGKYYLYEDWNDEIGLYTLNEVNATLTSPNGVVLTRVMEKETS